MFEKLQALLTAHEWEEAEQETARLLLQLANRGNLGWLERQDIQSIPEADLQKIDRLWLDASDGRFGFSVQQKIYQSVGGEAEATEEALQAFYRRVGWIVDDKLVKYSTLHPSINRRTPAGHLPSLIHIMFECKYGIKSEESNYSINDADYQYMSRISFKSYFGGKQGQFLMRFSSINQN